MNEIILNYIREQLTHGQAEVEITEEDDLLGSGILDSLGMMRLILFLENEFDVSIPPEDMTIENFMTVSHIRTYLKK
jgi:acyl carrier protein